MAEKINKKVGKAFAEMAKDVTGNIVSTVWSNGIRCYYDDSPYAIRQFVYHADHSWGTAYCDWSGNTRGRLVEALRMIGATKIKANVKWNNINITFNITKTKYKELCKEMGVDPTEVE